MSAKSIRRKKIAAVTRKGMKIMTKERPRREKLRRWKKRKTREEGCRKCRSPIENMVGDMVDDCEEHERMDVSEVTKHLM